MSSIFKQTEQYYVSLSNETKKSLFFSLVTGKFDTLVTNVQIEHPEIDEVNARKHVKAIFKAVKTHECGKLFPSNL